MRTHQQLAVAERREDDWDGLIVRSAHGDEIAFAELYDRSCALVNGLALRIVRDAAVAEEVTLDVYLQVWRQAARWDRSRGSARAWLLMLARSRAIDALRSAGADPQRRAQLERAPLVPCPEPSPEEHFAIGQRRVLVARACAGLSPEQRQAIELAYFGGMSHSEIADALDEPLGTVKTRIRAGMTRLRTTLVKSGAESW